MNPGRERGGLAQFCDSAIDLEKDFLQQLKESLDAFRAHGFEIAIDDFGVAYSSLRSVDELRPNYLKIDMDLIRDVHLDNYRSTLARKLIEAAKELRIKTIAEGIQSNGEYKWVKETGVDYVQGYYISAPAVPPPFLSFRNGLAEMGRKRIAGNEYRSAGAQSGLGDIGEPFFWN